MKTFLISDNRDTYLGLKLIGIDGVYLQKGENVSEEFNSALSRNYGIILLTEKIYSMIRDQVIETKKTMKYPLITVIPDRHGYGDEKEKITTYIKESIGF